MSARSAYVPLQFGGGEAFQFDWSEEGLVAYPGQGDEMLFDAHLRCLTGLGEVPRRGIYDNMKTAVHLYPERVAVVANAKVVAEHAQVLGRDRVIYDWRHYVPLIERKPGALRNRRRLGTAPATAGGVRTAIAAHSRGGIPWSRACPLRPDE